MIMIKMVKLKCITLNSPVRWDWPDISELTIGKEYDVDILVIHREWKTTECSVINDKGEEMRVLGGHFEFPVVDLPGWAF